MIFRGKKGFTLVEMILTMIVTAAIALVVGQILVSGMESYSLIVDRREAMQGVRLAVNVMSGELREIANPQSDISAISQNSISFTNAIGNPVTYQILGSNLLRNSKVLASGMASGSEFAYYTSGGNVTANPAEVYRVGMTIRINSGDAAHGIVEAKSSAYLRNRYYESFSKN
jgi:prepilin-type N-terminal cleavage/methylation domain-containing protein